MIRMAALVTFLFLAINAAVLQAQEEEKPTPRVRGRAVVMDIDARILENGQVTWNEKQQKITIPGRPVEIKLIGENLVIVVRFTFIRNHGNGPKLLVAQGQIWIADPGQGVRYQASVQTIPLEFDETICYFPLGSQPENSASSIEVMLTLRQYKEN